MLIVSKSGTWATNTTQFSHTVYITVLKDRDIVEGK